MKYTLGLFRLQRKKEAQYRLRKKLRFFRRNNIKIKKKYIRFQRMNQAQELLRKRVFHGKRKKSQKQLVYTKICVKRAIREVVRELRYLLPGRRSWRFSSKLELRKQKGWVYGAKQLANHRRAVSRLKKKKAFTKDK